MDDKEFLNAVKDTRKARDYFLDQIAYTIGPDRLMKLKEKYINEFNLFDIRDYEDYLKGHIPYATHIPFKQLEDQLVKFSKDKVNIIYSYSLLCQRSKKAAYFLTDKGYPVMELVGGFNGWKKRDFEIVEDDASDYPG